MVSIIMRVLLEGFDKRLGFNGPGSYYITCTWAYKGSYMYFKAYTIYLYGALGRVGFSGSGYGVSFSESRTVLWLQRKAGTD